MDTLTILVVSGVVSAFAIFAGVLAYVERATRNLYRLREQAALQVESPTVVKGRKAA